MCVENTTNGECLIDVVETRIVVANQQGQGEVTINNISDIQEDVATLQSKPVSLTDALQANQNTLTKTFPPYDS